MNVISDDSASILTTFRWFTAENFLKFTVDSFEPTVVITIQTWIASTAGAVEGYRPGYLVASDHATPFGRPLAYYSSLDSFLPSCQGCRMSCSTSRPCCHSP